MNFYLEYIKTYMHAKNMKTHIPGNMNFKDVNNLTNTGGWQNACTYVCYIYLFVHRLSMKALWGQIIYPFFYSSAPLHYKPKVSVLYTGISQIFLRITFG